MNKTRGTWFSASCDSKHNFICCDKFEVRTPAGSIPGIDMRFTGWEEKQQCNVFHPTLLTTSLNFYESASTSTSAECRQKNHPATPPLTDLGYKFIRCLSNYPEENFIGEVAGPRECAERCRTQGTFAVTVVEAVFQCYCQKAT